MATSSISGKMRSLVAMGMAFISAVCLATETQLPEVTAPACSQPPFLDGVLTDECWQSAAVISNFAIFKQPGEIADHKAWLAWDEQWLYIAMEISHPAPKYIKQTVFEADGPVQADDSVEVFLDPGSTNAFYLHYSLNAANIKGDDVFYHDGDMYKRGQMSWRSATRLTEKGWNAEMAFSIDVMTRGQRGPDRVARTFPCDWNRGARFNICVNTIKPGFDSQGVLTSEELIQASWAPLLNGYLEPERFGTLLGIQPDSKASAFFLPALTGVEAGAYEFKDGQASYQMLARIQNDSSASGVVEVIVIDKPLAGIAEEARQRQALGIKQEQDVSVRVPLKMPGRRTAVVWIADALLGGAFDSQFIDEQAMQPANPFTAWLDRSYYTSEKEAIVVCRLLVPEKKRQGHQILVKDQSGKTAGRSDALVADTQVAVALDQFPDGKHVLAVEWRGKDGESMSVQNVELVKLPPNPDCETKVDQVNRVWLKDGQPFFPFGLIINGEVTSQDEDYFRHVAEAGYNTIVRWCGKHDDPQEYMAYLAVAQKYGLYVIDAPPIQPVRPFYNWMREWRGMKIYNQKTFSEQEEVAIALDDFEQMLPNLKKCWEMSARTPNLLGTYSVDEPNSSGGLPAANLAVMERFYREFKEIDPYRSITMLYSCNIPPGANWTQWSDILSYDPYVYPGRGAFDYGRPNFVSQQTIELKRRADSVHKITCMMPLAYHIGDLFRMPRNLTAAEQNCQTYLTIIHGAKGVMYYMLSQIYTQPAWDALSRLAQQMKILGPAIVAPEAPQEIEYQPVQLNAEKKIFPEVQAALFQHPDGRYIMLAANSAHYPMTAVFTVAGLQAPVENLFTRQTFTVNGNAFSEELEPYGVRAYVLHGLAAHRQPAHSGSEQPAVDNRNSKIQLTVAMLPLPENEAAAKTFAVDEVSKRKLKIMQKQKKNYVFNPSVELMSEPGVPDGIKPNMYLNWPLVGAPGALWGIETNNPYHGRQCLRLVHQFKGGEPPANNAANWRITTGICYLPMASKPATYTFSVYARAARDGEELGLYIRGMDPPKPEERWKLTRDWKRYSYTSEFKGAPILINQEYYLYTYNKDAVVWVDAMQLEEGDTPTEFEDNSVTLE
ncbi:MAG: sugar-binding protein [Kiritimatiellia bacterium]|jgi:hypothetical protein